MRCLPLGFAFLTAVSCAANLFAQTTTIGPSTQPVAANEVVIDVKKGDSVFVAFSDPKSAAANGSTGQAEVFESQVKGFIRPDATPEKWQLTLRWVNEPGEIKSTKKLNVIVSTNNGEAGSMFPRVTWGHPLDSLAGAGVEAQWTSIGLTEVDGPKVQDGGVTLYKFVYGVLDGKPQHVIVAIGDRGLFPKYIEVPKEEFDSVWAKHWYPWDPPKE